MRLVSRIAVIAAGVLLLVAAGRALPRSAWKALTGVVRRPGARPFVRLLTHVHSTLYRATGGRAQAPSFPTLLLDTPGRASGIIRTTPLVYLEDGPDWIIAAAYSGAEKNPSWWLNLRAAGQAEIQIGTDRTRVNAHKVRPEEREDLWNRLCRMYPPFRDYETRTERTFPVIRLSPAP